MAKIKNVSDFRGAGRLTIDAVTGITDLTEDLHYAIASVGGKLGARNQHRTKGITGFVYRNIRTVPGLVGGHSISFVTPSISDINLTKCCPQNSVNNHIEDDDKGLQSLDQINIYWQTAFLLYFVKSWQKFSFS